MPNEALIDIPVRFHTDVRAGVRPMPSRVVYIHPQRRFYIAEFRSPITGETFRESFYFEDRRHKPRRTERTRHENDCNF